MPFRTLKLGPGVNLELSSIANTVQLAASNLVRFYNGLVQKLGGWVQLTSQLFVGTCRGLHGWSDIVGNGYMAVGTEQRLQLFLNGSIVDITPVAQTDNPGVSFSTIINTPNVVIADSGYAPAVGDWISLQTQVAVAGLILFGYYVVTAVGSNVFTINAGANAASTVNGAGAVPSYTTVNTQSVVTVVLANHGFVTGSIYNAAVTTTVATVVIFGLYSVTFVNSNTFTILTTGTANAGTTASENSGNARIQYLLPTGSAINSAAVGYGSGDCGGADYGGSVSTTQITIPLRQWSLDHWGQDLIASPAGGGIYYWQPPVVSPAIVVSVTAPLYSLAVFVFSQAEIIISLGAEVSGTLQPLLIRWCDVADFTDWTTTATNQAGSFMLSSGSTLVGGFAVGLGAIIWTDEGPWSMTYIGFPLVFGFNPISKRCGLVAQRAFGNAGTLVMWLALHQFYQMSLGGGAATPLECPVWDFYFENVDFTQTPQIHCAVNEIFNEMAWHFPIKVTSPLYNPLAPMAYVKYNYAEPGNVWDYGISSQYQRTAWAPHSPVAGPTGADPNGLLQQHEQGFDANGAAMQWSWQTGFFSMAESEEFSFSDFLIPDFVTVGTPSFIPNLITTDYPNGPTTQIVTQMVNTGQTYFITYGARGRFMSVGFSGPPSDLGTFNRLGAIKVRAAPDGNA